MRKRGQVYWDWADPNLHSRNYDERLPCNTAINVQVRMSALNVTQLFVGIYGEKGMLLHEESHAYCQGQTMTSAMGWGLQRARERVAAMQSTLITPAVRKAHRRSI